MSNPGTAERQRLAAEACSEFAELLGERRRPVGGMLTSCGTFGNSLEPCDLIDEGAGGEGGVHTERGWLLIGALESGERMLFVPAWAMCESRAIDGDDALCCMAGKHPRARAIDMVLMRCIPGLRAGLSSGASAAKVLKTDCTHASCSKPSLVLRFTVGSSFVVPFISASWPGSAVNSFGSASFTFVIVVTVSVELSAASSTPPVSVIPIKTLSVFPNGDPKSSSIDSAGATRPLGMLSSSSDSSAGSSSGSADGFSAVSRACSKYETAIAWKSAFVEGGSSTFVSGCFSAKSTASVDVCSSAGDSSTDAAFISRSASASRGSSTDVCRSASASRGSSTEVSPTVSTEAMAVGKVSTEAMAAGKVSTEGSMAVGVRVPACSSETHLSSFCSGNAFDTVKDSVSGDTSADSW
mmetsp:Transcript_53163/g.93352  ORF Transcript_53163/g.93352 Transcript_53163/m.93352 type:complete len:411 (+) Transcript_53163:1010-2242(+)